jgi:hypothetical protein
VGPSLCSAVVICHLQLVSGVVNRTVMSSRGSAVLSNLVMPFAEPVTVKHAKGDIRI